MNCNQESEQLTFDELPISVQLKIFSYLDLNSIFAAEHVSSSWKCLSSDDVLWNKRLKTDIRKWNVIGSNFNPLDLSHLSSKDIYHKCSPITRKLNNDSFIDKFTKVLRSIVVGKVPRLVMFGPGLDGGEVRLVRRLLQDTSKTFQCIDLHPSEFGGVGSGVVLRLLHQHLDFVLITLYTAPKHLREARSASERNTASIFVPSTPQTDQQIGDVPNRTNTNFQSSIARNLANIAFNNTLSPNRSSPFNNNNNPHYPLAKVVAHSAPPRTHLKLQKNIQHLMKSSHGLIYVLDASATLLELESGIPELLALSQQLHPLAPILILLCSKLKQQKQLTCIDVVKSMTLTKLSRPWQAHHCIVEGMLGVEKAFHWIVEASRS